ncbi:MAG TPA: hypothetical protein VN495_00660 [Candidatus Paceibacterota bacterium]|nr:hypothetical protein [Candidatus Paceibacterota bacterium]
MLSDKEWGEKWFAGLPLVAKGESKEVRYIGGGRVAIRLLPTVYSYTYNRYAVIPGSDKLRLRACKVLVEVLREMGIAHAYEHIGTNYIFARLVLPTSAETAKYGTPEFVPLDLTKTDMQKVLRAPPIEVIIKNNLSGTTPKTCHFLAGARVRASHRKYAGYVLLADERLPERVIRFDWRNPLRSREQGELVAGRILSGYDSDDPVLREHIVDETSRLPDVPFSDFADWFIDTTAARPTARAVADVLETFLGSKGIAIYDLCLFIDELGTTVFGEISPDCGRFRAADGSLDKDVWRAGGSHADVLRKWEVFCERIGA